MNNIMNVQLFTLMELVQVMANVEALLGKFCCEIKVNLLTTPITFTFYFLERRKEIQLKTHQNKPFFLSKPAKKLKF